MPCIQIKTNVQVSNETAQTVKSQLGRIITHLPREDGGLADGHPGGPVPHVVPGERAPSPWRL